MKIRAIVKNPREAYGHLTEIENELSALQRIVGGYIEVIRYKNLLIICNEDGNLRRLEPNLYLSKTLLVGTIIICGKKDGEFADVPIDFQNWKNIVNMSATDIRKEFK